MTHFRDVLSVQFAKTGNIKTQQCKVYTINWPTKTNTKKADEIHVIEDKNSKIQWSDKTW